MRTEGVIGLIICVMDMLGVQSNKLNGSLEIEVSLEGYILDSTDTEERKCTFTSFSLENITNPLLHLPDGG